jgi:ankyrin repeat protein
MAEEDEEEELELELEIEDEEESLPIFQAAARGDVDEVARLLDAEPHLLEARDGRRYDATPLAVAALEGHVGVVRLLLERGAEVHAAGLGGDTALHEAALAGHEKVVKVLLSSGADSSIKTNNGCTALICVSWGGHVGVVKQLLHHMQGRGLNERSNSGSTAVWWTCRYGRVEGLRLLLLAGADHTIGNTSGQTPRQIAEGKGHTECVALLEVSGTPVEVGHLRV